MPRNFSVTGGQRMYGTQGVQQNQSADGTSGSSGATEQETKTTVKYEVKPPKVAATKTATTGGASGASDVSGAAPSSNVGDVSEKELRAEYVKLKNDEYVKRYLDILDQFAEFCGTHEGYMDALSRLKKDVTIVDPRITYFNHWINVLETEPSVQRFKELYLKYGKEDKQ